ncbi:MAG: NAD(P)/FAD-dependent oxidoreductase [Bacteroidota bacterium]
MLQRIELVLPPEEAATGERFGKLIASRLGVSETEIRNFRLARRSIDARSRQVKIRLFFDVALGEDLPPLIHSERIFRDVSISQPVLIAGAGPAGLFAALQLIELGYKPVLFERGKDVRSRRRDLALMNRQGVVDPDSNYCFGEGGAGTYSDGKLYTRSDKRGNIRRILDTFIQFGASPDIAIDAHPHIGTNKLPGIVAAMRERIVECGGEVHFGQRVDDILVENGRFTGLRVADTGNESTKTVPGKALILATGHSARDIFRLLQERSISIEAKDFALGVRIEHPQSRIDGIQYHCTVRPDALPAAAYSLSGQYEGRGVYSFCMCPGGIIAPAATAPGEVVVNGWSPSKRNNPFANSGLVASVGQDDFKPYSASKGLAAMMYQSAVEKACYDAGGGRLVAPAQCMTDFCEGRFTSTPLDSSYVPGLHPFALQEVLPKGVTQSLKKALMEFGKKMKGYYTDEAVLVATESRTSSPVRIPRDPVTCMHPEVQGLFPCAEGAGYAGGIVSAAMDGERCAEGVGKYLG